MGLHLKLVNFNELFKCVSDIVILNDLQIITESDRDYVNSIIYTHYVKTDLFSNEPSCNCEALKGGYNLNSTCNICKTKVVGKFDSNITPVSWIRSPNGVAPLMNPALYTMLSSHFMLSGFDIIEWLCNTDYRPSTKIPDDIYLLESLGIQRGYNNFYDKFDIIIDVLFTLKKIKTKPKNNDIKKLISQNRDSLFSKYICLPNKSLLVVESTNSATYIDQIMIKAIDAIRIITGIDVLPKELSLRQKENRAVKVIIKLADFYYSLYYELLSTGNGLFRRHIFGTRNHFSVRAVISSNTTNHTYNHIYIGWGHACSLLKIHIANKLYKLDYTPSQVTAMVQDNANRYNIVLDNIFKELISESPEGGIPCYYVRNPSLARGSTQKMLITKVKTNVRDVTISSPILNVVGFNADFDGDQMSIVLALDNYTSNQLEDIAPHKNMLSLNKPRSITNNARFPKPVASTIANWIHTKENNTNSQKQIDFMNSVS